MMAALDAELEAVVVGAGQAGLAMSRCLQRAGIAHAVLEREAVGASWRRRWDSFRLNTPNATNLLPDASSLPEPDAFLGHDRWLAQLDAYRQRFDLPVRCGVEVRAIRPARDGYEVTTSEGVAHARHVVLCSGDQNVPRRPALAAQLPPGVVQLHSHEYRSAGGLPPGAVLVVGSAQSGGQIAEDLLGHGRAVWLSTSRVAWTPRRYRGRDITVWAGLSGRNAQRPADVSDAERAARQPLLTGVDGGHSLSLHALARAGARLLGRLEAVDGGVLRFAGDLLDNVAHGDAAAAKARVRLDAYIERTGIDAPAPDADPAAEPFSGLAQMAAIRSLQLDDAGIGAVIFATGFGGDFSYLPAKLLDGRGIPHHEDGVCAPGLYCVGLTWMRSRGSGLIRGVAQDAQFILDQILQVS